MKKVLFALLLGIAAGYFYGFADAQRYQENIVARTVAKVGGKNRDSFRNDVDEKVDRATR